MSQKTHPTSLRIASKYKNFYSCWYSDYFYSEMLSYDLEVRSYLQSVCDQNKHSQVIIRFQNHYKRFFISFFLFDARGIRHSTEKSLRLPFLSLQTRSRPDSFLNVEKTFKFIQFLIACKKFSSNYKAVEKNNVSYKKNELNLNALLSTQNGISDLFQAAKSTKNQIYLTTYKNDICSFLDQVTVKKKQNESVAKLNTFHSFLEKNIRSTPFDLTTIYPVKILQEIQNAEFLAGEIVYLLQKRAHFRQIQSFVLRKVAKNASIKGIRLSCSGRVGGRSKKAQKSKTQSVQWGETSLHVFSSKLDFASKNASTLFGKVGIKVWLCYK